MYYRDRNANRRFWLYICKVCLNVPRNASEAIKFFVQESLQLFQLGNNYLLTRDGFVIIIFAKQFSQANNSCGISLELCADYSDKASPIQLYGDEATLLSNEKLEEFGFEFLFFICQCYMQSTDFELKGTIEEKALRIQRKTELPWDVAHLVANVSDDEIVQQCASEIKEARRKDFIQENLVSQLCSGDKIQIRMALKELLSEGVYNALQLDKRGYRYLNALSNFIITE